MNIKTISKNRDFGRVPTFKFTLAARPILASCIYSIRLAGSSVFCLRIYLKIGIFLRLTPNYTKQLSTFFPLLPSTQEESSRVLKRFREKKKFHPFSLLRPFFAMPFPRQLRGFPECGTILADREGRVLELHPKWLKLGPSFPLREVNSGTKNAKRGAGFISKSSRSMKQILQIGK